jgi:hypothetical protein
VESVDLHGHLVAVYINLYDGTSTDSLTVTSRVYGGAQLQYYRSESDCNEKRLRKGTLAATRLVYPTALTGYRDPILAARKRVHWMPCCPTKRTGRKLC